jgi:hypothetical protein
MKRPVVIDSNPFVEDYFRKNAATLLDDVGGNTGNLAFRYGVFRQLQNPVLLPWNATDDMIRRSGDVIVLALANQLGSHTDLGSQARRLKSIGLPVVGLGLGGQAKTDAQDINLTDGTKSWLETIAALAPSGHANIGVRGQYTFDQIAKLGFPVSASVIGCPSNFINLTDDIADQVGKGFKRKISRIAVAAGIPHVAFLAHIEQNLADIVTQTGGAYIVQHGLEMLRLSRNEFQQLGPELFAFCKRYIYPAATDEQFELWCSQYAYSFFDVRAWMDFLRRFDFVIGTRFHGVMLAIQAGVPAGCIAHDSRTLELCKTMGVPVCDYKNINGPITKNNILDYFSYDDGAFRDTRRNLCRRYVDILQSAEIQPAETLMRWFAR